MSDLNLICRRRHFRGCVFVSGRRYGRAGRNGDGNVMLSPAGTEWAKQSCDDNSGKHRTRWTPSARTSTREGMLKTELKLRQRTRAAGKDRPQMFHGLQQRLHLPAGRWRQLTAKPCPHLIQSTLQPSAQPIDCFQGEGQPQFFHGGFEGKPGQQFHQPRPHQRSGQRVPWENVRQQEGKGLAAAAALPAMGAKYPLAANHLAAALSWIIAVKKTVPIQRLDLAAAGTALLFERKSRASNVWRSRRN